MPPLEWDEERMFAEYVGMGDSRAYIRVAKLFGCAKKTIVAISQRNHWLDRLAFIEAEARKEADRRLLEQRTEVHQRHLQLIRAIQQRGAQGLQEHRFDNARDASRAVTDAIRLELNVLGEPDQRLGVTIQGLTKREVENFVTGSLFPEEDDDLDGGGPDHDDGDIASAPQSDGHDA